MKENITIWKGDTRKRGTFFKGVFRGCDRDLLVLSPTAHFSQQLEKWAKEPEETKGFFTSLRAVLHRNMTHCAARSRKYSFIVSSKDCLSNSAAAADTHAEQRFLFYRCNSERQRREREVSSSYGTTKAGLCERVVQGISIRKA